MIQLLQKNAPCCCNSMHFTCLAICAQCYNFIMLLWVFWPIIIIFIFLPIAICVGLLFAIQEQMLELNDFVKSVASGRRLFKE